MSEYDIEQLVARLNAENEFDAIKQRWSVIGPELLEALEDAIAELNEWCIDSGDGEGFNKPSFNDLISRAKAINAKPTKGE